MALYLITGGCGFIGSHLADALLAAGHRIRILDDLSTGRLENKPEGAEFLEGSVTDPRAVSTAMQGVTGCFHLAAVASVERSSIEWTNTHRTNLTGSITVFDAARRLDAPIPVVYASSAAVYGSNDDIPLTEATTPRPLSAYGADKLGSEQHAFVASRVHKVPTCGLRFFNVFGPRQDPTSPYSGVISIFCNCLATGRGITIFGDGQQVRDFIFVGDVVRALMRSMERISCEARVFNVCTGRGVTVFNLAQSIQDILGVSVEPTYAPARPGEVRRSIGDPTLARAVLGFEATVNLRSGLEELLLNNGSAQVQRRLSEQRSSFSTEAPALLV
jgi:UDP-glucose 4-epimerase